MNKVLYLLIVIALTYDVGAAEAALQSASDLASSATVIEASGQTDPSLTEPKADISDQSEIDPKWSREADAISEKYGNWTFECRRYSEGPRCSISQKVDIQLGIEILQPDTKNTNKALLLLPFGLAVSEGITLLIDNKPADHRIPFSTCASEGCIVPMVVADESMDQFLAGTQLKIVSFDAISLKRKEFSIPLNGIIKAYHRLKNY
ncbi:invasion associated locus B family protein [Brucella pituitosa]|uniref:invasion associated locus B family protein n=1 Tax=Brucella pituitosa TaxID=571256 RepID=UPI003F4A9482